LLENSCTHLSKRASGRQAQTGSKAPMMFLRQSQGK
jgi:hypothetical protein